MEEEEEEEELTGWGRVLSEVVGTTERSENEEAKKGGFSRAVWEHSTLKHAPPPHRHAPITARARPPGGQHTPTSH